MKAPDKIWIESDQEGNLIGSDWRNCELPVSVEYIRKDISDHQIKALRESLQQIIDQKFDGRTAVIIQSDMKEIAIKALNNQ